MVLGNVALAANTPDAADVLRNITPHLDLAGALGAKLVRVMLQTADDVAPAQSACDEAAERGITLAQQTHWGTMAETVEQALDLVARVNRANFGITYELSNLMACGADPGPASLERLAPHIVNVYFQNVRLDPAGKHTFATRAQGVQPITYLPLDDADGIAIAPLIGELKRSAYAGWVTVHQPLRDAQTVPEAIAEAARVFIPLAL
jgi:sugar phosphate isomerase/epimerase